MTENLVVCSKMRTINRLPPSRPAIDAKCGEMQGQGVRRASGRCPLQRSSTARSRAAPSRFSSMSGHLGADHVALMAPAYEAAARELEPQCG